MINKIKHFVKNILSRKATGELIDQDELLDQENSDSAIKIGWKEKLGNLFSKLPSIKITKSSRDGRQLLSPSLTKSIDRFLSQESRQTIHQVALILIVTAATYSIGKITALTLRGTPMIESAKNYSVQIDSNKAFQPNTLAQVKNINIFRTNTGIGGKKKVAETCLESQQASSLPIKLVNTVVLQDSVKSIASVQIRGDRTLQEIREGDQISNLAKVFKITRLDVLVKNLESGVCESISSAKGREENSPISVMTPAQSKAFNKNKKISGIDNVGNKYSISKNLIDEKMKDIAAVLSQARAIKMQNPDGTISFKLTEMDPEGIFPYLGLEDQDIITSINGKPIYDMNEVMGLFSKIKNLDNLSLGIKREGSDSLKEYSIKK